jgi:hypothetical protein
MPNESITFRNVITGDRVEVQVAAGQTLEDAVLSHGIGKVVVCVHLTAGGRMRELAGTTARRDRVRLRLAGVLAYRDIPRMIMVIR